MEAAVHGDFNAKRGRNSGVNLTCLRQSSQAHHVNVGVGSFGPAADELGDEAGLADTAWTCDGHEPSQLRKLSEVFKFDLAADERRVGRNPCALRRCVSSVPLFCVVAEFAAWVWSGVRSDSASAS